MCLQLKVLLWGKSNTLYINSYVLSGKSGLMAMHDPDVHAFFSTGLIVGSVVWLW